MISKEYYIQHLNRIRAGINPSKTVETIAGWLTEHTTIGGKRFSFKDHEYQQTLLEDRAQVKFCIKCSQIGISELSIRRALAALCLYPNINLAYVLPTATFASTFSATRFASALESCRPAKEMLYKTDSSMIKRLVNESYIYFRGASRAGQAISIPLSRLCVDEVDFAEDQDVLTSFTSRMTHADPSVYDQFWFSTPTVTGYGISHLFENSIQHVEMQTCCHCNHQFVPEYYANVKLPGFNVPLSKATSAQVDRERSLQDFNFLSKELLTKYKVNSAYLECPKCRRPVDQNIKYRRFVQVNPDSNFEEHGYKIAPFSAPLHMPPSKMIKTSTLYRSVKDFSNNCLGLPHSDETTGLSREEVEALFTSDIRYPDTPSYQVCGVDLGGECATFTAFPAPDGHLRIMHAELIPLTRMRSRIPELFGQNRVISGVSDAMPYTDLVSQLQGAIPSLFAALYTQTKGMELYSIRDQQEDETKATYGIRQLNVKKNLGLDLAVSLIRSGKISFAPATFHMRETIIRHFTDMKRINMRTLNDGEEFVWQKSAQGADHFFHALLYLILSNFIKGLSGGMAPLPMLACGMKVKTEV